MDQLKSQDFEKKLEYIKYFHPVSFETAIKAGFPTSFEIQGNLIPATKMLWGVSLAKDWRILVSNWKDFKTLKLLARQENDLQLKQLLCKIANMTKNMIDFTICLKSNHLITSIGLESLANILSSHYRTLQSLTLHLDLSSRLKLLHLKPTIRKTALNLPNLEQITFCLRNGHQANDEIPSRFVTTTTRFLSKLPRMKHYSLIFKKFQVIHSGKLQDILSSIFKNMTFQTPNFSISFLKLFETTLSQDILEFICQSLPNIPTFTGVPQSAGTFERKGAFKIIFALENFSPRFRGFAIHFDSQKPKVLQQFEIDQNNCSQYFQNKSAKFSTRTKIAISQALNLFRNSNQLLYQYSLSFNLKNCYGIDDENLQQIGYDISVFSPFMKDLTFQFTNTKNILLSDTGLEFFLYGICRNLASSLESLNLGFNGCVGISDEGLKSLGSDICGNLKNLTHLRLSFQSCKQITKTGVSDLINQIYQSLGKLTSLYLDFRFCDGNHFGNLQEQKAQEIIKALPNLANFQMQL